MTSPKCISVRYKYSEHLTEFWGATSTSGGWYCVGVLIIYFTAKFYAYLIRTQRIIKYLSDIVENGKQKSEERILAINLSSMIDGVKKLNYLLKPYNRCSSHLIKTLILCKDCEIEESKD
ncbi:hypothetical protein GQX74_002285 [Glossina fuscipes]|nr:hypothetical protein GQX74_002285 [Glossina fuscipes]